MDLNIDITQFTTTYFKTKTINLILIDIALNFKYHHNDDNDLKAILWDITLDFMIPLSTFRIKKPNNNLLDSRIELEVSSY